MSNYVHRRGSIFWALTLIAVGVLFLYHNFNPALRPWHIIAQWWPVLIIFWGLSKLMDHLHARAHPETVPPPLFSASEVVLLVLILVMGTLVSKLVLRPWQEWPAAFGIDVDEDWGGLFMDAHTYTETVTQEVKAPGSLLVVVRRGNVEVHGSDGNTIEAVVKKQVRAPSEAEARQLADKLKVEIVEQAGRYLLQTNLGDVSTGPRQVRLDLALRVPKQFSLEVTSDRGEVSVDELVGDQTLTARRGEVRVVNVEGLVRVRASRGSVVARGVKGNVEIEGRGRDIEVAGVTGTVVVNGDFSGAIQLRDVAQTLRFTSSRTDLNVQKLTGRLDMEVGWLEADGVDGPFELTTRQKDITLTEFRHSVRIQNTNGDVRLRTSTPPKQPITVSLQKGAIELVMPPNSEFQVQATSNHGDVDSDFAGLTLAREGRVPSISGTQGKGGPAISLSTSYGTIRVAHSAPTTAPRHARPRRGPVHPELPEPPEAPPPPSTQQGTPPEDDVEAFTQANVRHSVRAGDALWRIGETAGWLWARRIAPHVESATR
jgi:DUF4097 and DUF4098 domain-containing protein YvlB